jgi:cytochrome c oxidase cbb3-type subunit 4
MNLDAIIGSISTVVAFATFVGIVIWAYAKRRRAAFAEAANAPFALPDDLPDAAKPRAERKS